MVFCLLFHPAPGTHVRYGTRIIDSRPVFLNIRETEAEESKIRGLDPACIKALRVRRSMPPHRMYAKEETFWVLFEKFLFL